MTLEDHTSPPASSLHAHIYVRITLQNLELSTIFLSRIITSRSRYAQLDFDESSLATRVRIGTRQWSVKIHFPIIRPMALCLRALDQLGRRAVGTFSSRSYSLPNETLTVLRPACGIRQCSLLCAVPEGRYRCQGRIIFTLIDPVAFTCTSRVTRLRMSQPPPIVTPANPPFGSFRGSLDPEGSLDPMIINATVSQGVCYSIVAPRRGTLAATQPEAPRGASYHVADTLSPSILSTSTSLRVPLNLRLPPFLVSLPLFLPRARPSFPDLENGRQLRSGLISSGSQGIPLEALSEPRSPTQRFLGISLRLDNVTRPRPPNTR